MERPEHRLPLVSCSRSSDKEHIKVQILIWFFLLSMGDHAGSLCALQVQNAIKDQGEPGGRLPAQRRGYAEDLDHG